MVHDGKIRLRLRQALDREVDSEALFRPLAFVLLPALALGGIFAVGISFPIFLHWAIAGVGPSSMGVGLLAALYLVGGLFLFLVGIRRLHHPAFVMVPLAFSVAEYATRRSALDPDGLYFESAVACFVGVLLHWWYAKASVANG